MRQIRTTTIDSQGNQVHNQRLTVMTEEDLVQIKRALESSLDVDRSAIERFDAMDNMIRLLNQKIDLLEQILIRQGSIG